MPLNPGHWTWRTLHPSSRPPLQVNTLQGAAQRALSLYCLKDFANLNFRAWKARIEVAFSCYVSVTNQDGIVALNKLTTDALLSSGWHRPPPPYPTPPHSTPPGYITSCSVPPRRAPLPDGSEGGRHITSLYKPSGGRGWLNVQEAFLANGESSRSFPPQCVYTCKTFRCATCAI